MSSYKKMTVDHIYVYMIVCIISLHVYIWVAHSKVKLLAFFITVDCYYVNRLLLNKIL